MRFGEEEQPDGTEAQSPEKQEAISGLEEVRTGRENGSLVCGRRGQVSSERDQRERQRKREWRGNTEAKEDSEARAQ